jgi:hypothetical protein
MSEKAASAWHPRPCPPWACRWCGVGYGTDQVCEIHERKCQMRPEGDQ